MWIHSARCPETAVLWFGHGFRADDWISAIYRCCPYQCPGQPMGDCVTHSHDCAWWDWEYNPQQVTPLDTGPELSISEKGVV